LAGGDEPRGDIKESPSQREGGTELQETAKKMRRNNRGGRCPGEKNRKRNHDNRKKGTSKGMKKETDEV